MIHESEPPSSDSESMSILTIYDPLDSDSYTSLSTSPEDDDSFEDEGIGGGEPRSDDRPNVQPVIDLG